MRRGQLNLADAAARTAAKPADVVSDFKKADRNCFQLPARFHDRVFRALRFEMILRFAKGDAGTLLQVSHHLRRKIDVPVQAGTDCRAAERQFLQDGDRFPRTFLGIGDLLRVTAKALAKPDRRRVHQMRPSNFNDVVKVFGFAFECGP